MKAERRHELKTNTLALAMQRLPELWKRYGAKVLLGVLAVAVVVVLVYNRVESSRRQARQDAESVGVSRSLLSELQQFNMFERFADPEQVAARRREVITEAERFINTLLTSRNRQMQAEGYVALGDLRWAQANLPQLPGAATQPALQVDPQRTQEELLADAERAYQRVLELHPDRPMQAISARFGLAAIAENRGDWDTARQHYQTILDDEQTLEAFQTQAQARLATLDEIRRPIFIGQPLAQRIDPMLPGIGEMDIAPLGPELEPFQLPQEQVDPPPLAPQELQQELHQDPQPDPQQDATPQTQLPQQDAAQNPPPATQPAQ
jgi:tetratricopeptide (TPR) repeat protein